MRNTRVLLAALLVVAGCESPTTREDLDRRASDYHPVQQVTASPSLQQRLPALDIARADSALVANIIATTAERERPRVAGLLADSSHYQIVGAKDGQIANKVGQLYALRAQASRMRRLEFSREAARHTGAVVTFVLVDHTPSGEAYEVRRRRSAPRNVILLDRSRASAADLGPAMALLRRSRQALGDDIESEAQIRVSSGSGSPALRTPESIALSAHDSDFYARLRQAPIKSVAGFGSGPTLQVRIGPEQ